MAGPQNPDDPSAQLPESVILQKFKGLRNTVQAERLGPEDLQRAQNIDIDNEGQVSRRRGFDRVATGSYHSLFNATFGTFVVKNSALGYIDPLYSFTSLTTVGDDPLAYVEVGGNLYYSSADASGVVDSSYAVSSWGASTSAGTWLSPVVNPTTYLGEIKGKLLGKPPMATALAYYNGRIYLAHETTLWATELFLYNYVDKTKNYKQFESKITLVGAVSDGLYVGTETGVYFLGGDRLDNLKMKKVSAAAAIPGSMVYVSSDRVTSQIPGNQPYSSKLAILFLTTSGLCAGLDGGVCYDLTQDRVWFPASSSAAAMVREQDGVSQYVGVMDSGGTPASTTRIGDYVDAEIRRFQGA
jgi:hypothetical protein